MIEASKNWANRIYVSRLDVNLFIYIFWVFELGLGFTIKIQIRLKKTQVKQADPSVTDIQISQTHIQKFELNSGFDCQVRLILSSL